MSEVKKWHMPRGTSVSEGEDGEFVLASDYDAIAEECERLRREAKNDAIAYKAAIERQNEIRTERDAAIAELAALKGGQEPVAMLRYARQVPGFENEMPHVVSCNDMPDGLYEVYLAPPAQASAWVPEGWKLVPVEPTEAMLEIGAQCVYEPTGKGDIDDVWSNMLAAAPTPGASDGKGGE